jgi:hypothetical protein
MTRCWIEAVLHNEQIALRLAEPPPYLCVRQRYVSARMLLSFGTKGRSMRECMRDAQNSEIDARPA